MYKFLKGQYPTREEILDEHLSKETTFEPGVVNFCNSWKKEWKRDKNRCRYELIRDLIRGISDNKETETPRIRQDMEAETPYYIPSCKTIFLNRHLSIISALHELGHHLYGESELLACRFSVHLFKEVFPKAFSKLVWGNGMFHQSKEICSSAQPVLI